MYAWLIGQRERVASIVAGSALLAPVVAFAAGESVNVNSTGIPKQWQDFPSVIENVFKIVITVAGVVFVILFLVGGVMYLAAAGNEDNTKKATKLMLDAVIGLVLILISWAVGTYVLRLLGVSQNGDQLNVYTPVK